MNILVTGSKGFAGKNLVCSLQNIRDIKDRTHPELTIDEIYEYDIDLTGKNVTILGRSNIVGKPLIQCCLNKNATVTVCHSKTKDLKEHTKNADIVISAIGKAKFVTADMIKDGAVVIDVGINRDESGKIVGDVDFEKVSSKASYITPVPGGVGPMTIAMLMNNVIKATKLQNRRSETL